VLLCGLLTPREDMQQALQWVANVLPLTYAIEAMEQVTAHTGVTGTYLRDTVFVAAIAVGSLVVGAATLRRRTA
jgi:ABC-2 type transport system permease protein